MQDQSRSQPDMNHCHYLITNCPSKLIGSEVGLFQPVWILMIPPLTCKPAPSEFEKFDDFFFRTDTRARYYKPLRRCHCLIHSPRTSKPFRNFTVTFIYERVYFVWRDASHPRNTLSLALKMIYSHPIDTDEPIPRIQKTHIFLTKENLPSKSNCQRSFC